MYPLPSFCSHQYMANLQFLKRYFVESNSPGIVLCVYIFMNVYRVHMVEEGMVRSALNFEMLHTSKGIQKLESDEHLHMNHRTAKQNFYDWGSLL